MYSDSVLRIAQICFKHQISLLLSIYLLAFFLLFFFGPSLPFMCHAERVCPGGQVFSDCVSSCPPSCSSALPPASGQCREECVGGCECPPGLYLHDGQCLRREHCPCFHRRRTYREGDTIKHKCNTW